ncbi:hypothetical protein AB1L30_02260 [Bremerella sp. JC817]|uniref:hypothetical protein n=1 Tax=Bremerella sp. JC817 TaxID=3231756 RepID=UPI003457B6DE
MFSPQHRQARFGGAQKVVLIVLAAVGGLALVGCLSCGGLAWFGWSAGMEAIATEVRSKYGDNPAIQEHIGEIEGFSMNFTKSQQAREEYGNDDVLLFDISGPKGSGEMIIERQRGTKGFSGAILRTENGEEFDLD